MYRPSHLRFGGSDLRRRANIKLSTRRPGSRPRWSRDGTGRGMRVGTMETATSTIRFVTERGIVVPAVDSAQMREVDRIAVEETGPNLYQMMENAGRNLALLAIQLLDEGWERAKVLVLAGSGGNGGGGICAARHLANHNVNVAVCL